MRRAPFAAVLLLLAACGDEGPVPTEVWTPEDHAQPPQREVDPSRVPRQARAERSADPEGRAAAALYNVSCASCHGRAGAGDGPAAPGAMPSFLDPRWQESRTDQQIAAAIVRGQGMMPAFGDRIAPQGVAALVGYIRAFGEAAARARGMGGADGADGGEGESEAPESGEAPSEGGESAAEAAGEAAADPAAAATAE